MRHMIELHFLDTGYCTASEAMMFQGGERRTVECHALVGLLYHQQHGWGLWDVGYAARMLDATKRLPWRMYRYTTPLHLDSALDAVRQLPRFDLVASDIHWIVLSHLHADHVAGLADFPDARIILSAAAFDGVVSRNGMSALQRGLLPPLFPADWQRRVELIWRFEDEALPGLGTTHDLFGDGSILLVPLPGHAQGQIGALLQTQRGPVLLAADGAWHSRAIREQRPPHPATRFVVDDFGETVATLRKLKAFADARPDVLVVPTHCPEIFAAVVQQQ